MARKPTYQEIINEIKSHKDPEAIAGMARYGINPHNNYGVCMPDMMRMKKLVGKDHELALRLWSSGIRDARIIACLIDDPKMTTEEQMDGWVKDFNSWDVCDGCCLHLFSYSKFGHRKAREWSARDEEYVKRAGYVMMACLATHDKTSADGVFRAYLPIIVEGATDERNYVKKAVNWALRGIGKRNIALNRSAIETAMKIQKLDSKTARWVASDALRELRGDAVQTSLRRREAKKR
jgi:3-methyladenine DNA glycosylase AlkD